MLGSFTFILGPFLSHKGVLSHCLIPMWFHIALSVNPDGGLQDLKPGISMPSPILPLQPHPVALSPFTYSVHAGSVTADTGPLGGGGTLAAVSSPQTLLAPSQALT